jgi:hypothetical protein
VNGMRMIERGIGGFVDTNELWVLVTAYVVE